MKKKRQSSRGRAGSGEGAGKQVEGCVGEPLKRRVGLLITLSIIFSMWVIALLVMHFAKVYPGHQRQGTSGVGVISGF
ncbi:MAG: hypothetical protein NTU53_05365 [Planctomycetota bacterium]|nr:hypothetical protein [Planctomycetota bacterium]